jgi:hypothetical protein
MPKTKGLASFRKQNTPTVCVETHSVPASNVLFDFVEARSETYNALTNRSTKPFGYHKKLCPNRLVLFLRFSDSITSNRSLSIQRERLEHIKSCATRLQQLLRTWKTHLVCWASVDVVRGFVHFPSASRANSSQRHWCR